jgi:hypothetical protein
MEAELELARPGTVARSERHRGENPIEEGRGSPSLPLPFPLRDPGAEVELGAESATRPCRAGGEVHVAHFGYGVADEDAPGPTHQLGRGAAELDGFPEDGR